MRLPKWIWVLANLLAAVAFLAANANIGNPPRAAAAAAERHSWIDRPAMLRAKSTGLLFVSNVFDPTIDGEGAVNIYSAQNPTKPIGQIQGNLRWPGALAVDKSGNLFVYNGQTNEIYEFQPPYDRPSVKTISGFWGPIGAFTIDANDKMYLTSAWNDILYTFSKGSTSPTRQIPSPVGLDGVTLDAKGNIFCTYEGLGASGVLVYTPGSPIPTHLPIPLIIGYFGALDILFDASGNLVIDDPWAATISVYHPGAAKPSNVIDAKFAIPIHMAFGANKSVLYVSDLNTKTVKAIDYPSGGVRWKLSGFARPWGVAVSPAAIP